MINKTTNQLEKSSENELNKIKICPICDEESSCEYFLDYDHEMCCSCDESSEINKHCADCFSDYASNIYDEVKAKKEREMLN